MKTFRAHFDGRALVPDEPVDLPHGATLRVSAEPVEEDLAEQQETGFPLLEEALEVARQMEGDYPPDLARNHDHYLHGGPKR
jgi:hypothetical protein